MIRLTLSRFVEAIAAYTQILRGGSSFTMRSRLNFRGRVNVTDNATTLSTDVSFPSFATHATTSGTAYTASPWDAVIASGTGLQTITLPSDAEDGDQVVVAMPEAVAAGGGEVEVIDPDENYITGFSTGPSAAAFFFSRPLGSDGEWRLLLRYAAP